MEHFLGRITATIEKYKMFNFNDTVVVGVSGGPDSIALLHILTCLKEEYNLKLVVVHINHMFRGEEARREAEFVARLAQKWGLESRIIEKDIPQLIKEEGLSPQEAGHLMRKKIFAEIGQEIGAQKLALGHHADDRVETMLLHLIQGTGLEGLASMPPVHGWIIRPLAQAYKKEIIDYCHRYELNYVLDPSNSKPVYLRNKVRLELLPYLKKEFNPQMSESLLRLEDIVLEENRYLKEVENTIWDHVLTKKEVAFLTLDIPKLLDQHLALKRRIIRKAYGLLRPENQGIAFNHVEQILALAQDNRGAKYLNLPEQIKVQKDYHSLIFSDEKLELKAEENLFNYSWDIPGILNLPHKRLEASYTKELPTQFSDLYQVVLDGDKITTPLTVRQRKPGDRMRPLGMSGTKKIQDIFIDRKISKEERDKIPVVCSGQEIIWLPGITFSNDYKVKTSTKSYLYLKLVQDEYV